MTWTWLGICAAVFLLIAGINGYRRGFIKEIVSMFFVFLTLVLVWMINPYVNTFLKDNTGLYEKIQTTCTELITVEKADSAAALGESEQNSLIENLPLPEFVKNNIQENNNAEVYQYLSVNTFADYVAGYLAVAVFNGVSFLISYLLASLLIRVLAYALDIIAGLPILKGANKLTGAVVGIAKGIVFIWIACLVLLVLCNTQIGKNGLELIEKDSFLSFINERNLLTRVFMNIFYGN